MKRSAALVAVLIAVLLLEANAAIASIKGTGARTSQNRGVGVTWWTHDDSAGELHYLSASLSSRPEKTEVDRERIFYTTIPCKVGRRGRPTDCDFRDNVNQKLKILTLEIDPLLRSAHLVAHHSSGLTNLRFEGRGDYEPFAAHYLSEFVLPPDFVHASTGAWGYVFRSARVDGRVLGRRLGRADSLGASIGSSVGVSASVNHW
jgi:hypothetical protein